MSFLLRCIDCLRFRYKKRPLKFAAFKLLFIGLNIALNLVYYVIMDGHDVGYAFYINLVCTASITFCFYKELKEGFMGEKCSWSECKVLVRKMMGYSWPILVLGIAGILNQTADKILFPYIYEKGDAHAHMPHRDSTIASRRLIPLRYMSFLHFFAIVLPRCP